MVPNGIYNDFNAGSMAGRNHVGKLLTVSTLGSELVRHGLIICPPLTSY